MFLTSYCSIGVIIIILGMATCGTSVFNLVPVVLGEILGPEHVTSAMGIHMVYESAAIIATTFISGQWYIIHALYKS